MDSSLICMEIGCNDRLGITDVGRIDCCHVTALQEASQCEVVHAPFP